MIGVSIDDAMTREHVPGFVEEMGITYPIVVAEAEFIKNFYPTDNVTVPISVLLDAQGVISDLLPGWTAETREHLEAHRFTSVGLPGSTREERGPVAFRPSTQGKCITCFARCDTGWNQWGPLLSC